MTKPWAHLRVWLLPIFVEQFPEQVSFYDERYSAPGRRLGAS